MCAAIMHLSHLPPSPLPSGFSCPTWVACRHIRHHLREHANHALGYFERGVYSGLSPGLGPGGRTAVSRIRAGSSPPVRWRRSSTRPGMGPSGRTAVSRPAWGRAGGLRQQLEVSTPGRVPPSRCTRLPQERPPPPLATPTDISWCCSFSGRIRTEERQHGRISVHIDVIRLRLRAGGRTDGEPWSA